LARTPNNNKVKSKPGGSRYAALAILAVILLAVGGYFFLQPPKPAVPVRDAAIPEIIPTPPLPQTVPPTHVAPVKPPVLPDGTKSSQAPIGTAPSLEEKKPVYLKTQGTALLAIIIDDMGTTLQEARSLADIGVPLTYSIIPGLRKSQEVATFADTTGIETMIHIPMQSKGWPGRRLEANGLLMSMSDSEVIERTEGFVRSVPKAKGANNHTGSEFTEHEDKMRAVLGVLKGRGLFFVDSVTSPQTVGERLAKELGMKSGRRQVFLDNEQNDTYIRGQLNQAVRLAKKTGAAIAICHPHAATIQTLAAELPALQKQGITFVPASRLVK
jgi:polysaccharide deacetylase 2 family uncharacterized protein YibQ